MGFWKDVVGRGHEEQREKREEWCEAVPSDGCEKPEVGCPQCCEKIPKKLVCALKDKVKEACPEVYEKECGKAPATKKTTTSGATHSPTTTTGFTTIERTTASNTESPTTASNTGSPTTIVTTDVTY